MTPIAAGVGAGQAEVADYRKVPEMAAGLILELGVSTLGALGKVMGRDVTTLSSAAKRLQMRAKKDLRIPEANS